MNYDDVVRDFAIRTLRNLRTVEELRNRQLELDSSTFAEAHVYEVTQLINSLLGLLVFPQQRYFDSIPATPLSQLADQGWPRPLVTGKHPDVKTLRDLMRYLRNGIAHFNIEFHADDATRQISGLRIWNKKDGQINWSATLTLADLRLSVERFVALLVGEDALIAGRATPARRPAARAR